MLNLIKRLWHDKSGQDLIEYSLIAASLVVMVTGFLPSTVMVSVSTVFSKITSTMGIS